MKAEIQEEMKAEKEEDMKNEKREEMNEIQAQTFAVLNNSMVDSVNGDGSDDSNDLGWNMTNCMTIAHNSKLTTLIYKEMIFSGSN